MVETLFTVVKPVDDNNEIVEIQSVEEPIYIQELAEQITIEKDKEDVIVDVGSVEDTTSVHKIIDVSCGKKMERTSVIKYNGYSEIDFQKITQKDLSEIETTSPNFLEKRKVDNDCSDNENAVEDLRNRLKNISNVTIDMEDLDAFIQNNKHYILSLNPEENFWQTGDIDKLYNNFAHYDDALLKNN